MNKEEIEELKDFTIDLTDIDELALGLEVCSKKSNMVIQELIDTIVQLQQENQSLKKQLEEYKLITIDYQELEARNQKLKKQLEEYKRLGFEHLNDKCNKLENQQKEFVKYLENENNIYPYDISDYTYEDIINTILSKYYEIIEK